MIDDVQAMYLASTATTSPITPCPARSSAMSGAPVLAVRPARGGDTEQLRQLFRRCSPTTRHDRFHAALREIPPSYLREVTAGDPALHDALVAELPPTGLHAASLVAVGSAARVRRARHRTVEIAVLVEDRWQRQGLGTQLLLCLVDRARLRGVERVRWSLLSEARGLVQTLRREVGPLEISRAGEMIIAEASLIG